MLKMEVLLIHPKCAQTKNNVKRRKLTCVKIIIEYTFEITLNIPFQIESRHKIVLFVKTLNVLCKQ